MLPSAWEKRRDHAQVIDELKGYTDRKGNTKTYVPGVIVTTTTLTPLNQERMEKPLREVIWPWYKFFPENTERDEEYKVVCGVFKKMQPPFKGSPAECRQWQLDHTNVMAGIFNTTKNYVISRIKDAVKEYWTLKKGIMPDGDLLLACGDRTIDLTPPENLDMFMFYWDKLLPACTAPNVDSWGMDNRYYSKLSPKNDHITKADEAFLCLCITNYWARWEKIFELKELYPACKVNGTAKAPDNYVVPDGQPDPQFHVDEGANKIYLWGEYNGKYTITNSGSNRSGGWSAEGKTEYRRLWHAVKKGRKHKDTPAKETAVYDHLRSYHHITAMTAEEHRLRSRRGAVREIRQGPLVDLDETLADSDREE